MLILNEIVEKMFNEHKGGREFFDHLDGAVRETILIKELINMIYSRWPKSNPILVGSGTFGVFLYNYLTYVIHSDIKCLLVNGGLRDGKPIIDLTPFMSLAKNSNYVFLDDSFYSGRTYEIVRHEIMRFGGTVLGAAVIYDGSSTEWHDVISMYEYYKGGKE